MFSASAEPSVVVLITGRTLAGIKQIAAAMSSAQVYWMEWWWRHSSLSPQRGQYPGSAGSAGRDSKAQVSQETNPAWPAVSGIALIIFRA